MRGTETARRSDYDLKGELYFKRAFAHAAIGLALVDLEGHFRYTNAAYSKITGYTARELKTLTIGSLMYPEDAKANAALREKMLAGKIPGYVLEKRYIRKDGSLVWVNSSISLTLDSDGNPTGIVGITENVDQRRKADMALRESESRFRFMAESMPQKVFTADSRGVINYLSPQWVNYTGLTFKNMNFKDWSNTIHPDDREANLQAWKLAVRNSEPFYFEHRLRRADGAYRWHVSRAYPLCDAQGNVAEWIGSATDIEELRQGRELEARLRILAEQREQLISTNRLKDDFLMLASHQLRTPATGVKQYIGMLLQGYSDEITEDQRTLLLRAYESNDRQLRIVDDLLRVARIDAGQVTLTKTCCDAVQFVRGVVAERRNFFEHRKQEVQFIPPDEAVAAWLDTDLMRVVLENLLDNASKYSPPGKRTSVSLRLDHGSLVVEVTDHGQGIRKKDQPRLFQKFSRLHTAVSTEADNGSGLGLYWSKKIVELHGGTIEVISRPGKGATFSVRVPLS